MAVSFGFYNAKEREDGTMDRTYDAEDISKLFDGIIMDGVYASIGDRLEVRAIEGTMRVNVMSGRAWFNHTWTYVDGPTTINEIYDYNGSELSEISRHISYPKICSVVLEIDKRDESRKNRFIIICGEPAPEQSVKQPILKDGSDGIWQYRIANIYVSKVGSASSISQTDITYKVNTESKDAVGACFYVTGPVQSLTDVTPDIYINEWAAKFEEWYADFTVSSSNRFNEWFDNLVYTLDGDVGAKLTSDVFMLNEKINKNLNVKVGKYDSANNSLYLVSI